MKQYLFIVLLLSNAVCYSQNRILNKTDLNTVFVCIDSISYKQLYINKYIKDTLFFCMESSQETTTNSYTGKYLLGESATLEFLQPKSAGQIGDNFGDCGIEFKTRKIKNLDEVIKKAKSLNFPIDTATTKIMDSLPIPWYKTLSFKGPNSELAIMEYQLDYLMDLGFNKTQLNQSMTFKEFNNIAFGGKPYPRQFSMITYLKLYADKSLIDNLRKFAMLNNCKNIKNTFTNGETIIEYIKVDTLPTFPVLEIGISLLTEQKPRVERISEHLVININRKMAKLLFNYTQ